LRSPILSALNIGLFTDAFPDWSLPETLDWLRREAPSVTHVEIGTGGYSPVPHCDVGALLRANAARKAWLDSITSRGYEISALNVSGNPLHPRRDLAEKHDRDLRDTIRLAAALGVDRVVAMSGNPGPPGRPSDVPYFAAGGWLPEYTEIAVWQWEKKVKPYWEEMSAFARHEHPALRICFELHPGTYVYNTTTFKLAEPLGDNLGVNLDPSHFFWQGMNPLAIIPEVGSRVGHVHGKDTRMLPENIALNGVLDNRWLGEPKEMPWLFATVGEGHPATWWHAFVRVLAGVGFDGTISIECEDPLIDTETSVRRSAELLSEAVRLTSRE
jgi:sugar phosphate isomerase/epimerase